MLAVGGAPEAGPGPDGDRRRSAPARRGPLARGPATAAPDNARQPRGPCRRGHAQKAVERLNSGAGISLFARRGRADPVGFLWSPGSFCAGADAILTYAAPEPAALLKAGE